MGAFASRVTVMTGAAVTIAAAKLRGELLRVAGQLLQTTPERLAIAGDRIMLRDAPGGSSLDLARLRGLRLFLACHPVLINGLGLKVFTTAGFGRIGRRR
jgi:CO/xanthine dehydrogenase Mo-binding subunit